MQNIFFQLFIILFTIVRVYSEEIYPDPLSSNDFYSLIKDGNLHLIEFYSPYCSYCNHLAPTWRKTWEKAQEINLLANYNVTLDRVNCIENGDLCYDEKIDYFPSFRLYGPSGFIKYYPEDDKKTVNEFLKFVKQASKDKTNFQEKGQKDKSLALTELAFNELLNDPNLNHPYLISFWPTKQLISTDDDIDFENCYECLPFQRSWNLLSNTLDEKNIKTAHVNCESAVNLCKAMGYKDLTEIKNHRGDRMAKVALLVPGRPHSKNKVIRYNEEYFTDYLKVKDFAIRGVENAKVPDFNSNYISNYPVIDVTSYFEPESTDLESFVIYVNDRLDESDDQLLDSLIEVVSNAERTTLYKANVEDFYAAMGPELENFYGKYYNDKEYTFKDLIQLKLSTNLPAIYYIQKGQIKTSIFPVKKSLSNDKFTKGVQKWLNLFNIPLLTDITSWKFSKLMNYDKSNHRFILTELVDTSLIGVDKEIDSKLQKYHELQNIYEIEVDNWYLRQNSLPEGQEQRKIAIGKLRDKRKAGLITTFLDISEAKSFATRNGLVSSSRQYEIGDVIIIDRASGYVYNSYNDGESISVTNTNKILHALLSAQFSIPADTKFAGRLLGSPFPEPLKFMDTIHQYGVFGYITILVLIALLWNLKRILKLTKRPASVSNGIQKDGKYY